MAKLTLDDIADLRAYEREREAFRDHVIALKRRRRVAVGPIITVAFESVETIRFQVQEMARAERMLSDAAIQGELDAYNPLIPDRGELSATLFIELTSTPALREWLPRLVGIERAVAMRVGDTVVRARPEASHAEQLTREEITAAVHYLRWDVGDDAVAAWPDATLALVIDHPEYAHETALGDDTRAELLADLLGGA